MDKVGEKFKKKKNKLILHNNFGHIKETSIQKFLKHKMKKKIGLRYSKL